MREKPEDKVMLLRSAGAQAVSPVGIFQLSMVNVSSQCPKGRDTPKWGPRSDLLNSVRAIESIT
jgi:hypothetical protein